MGNKIERDKLLEVAKFLGMGFYRVAEAGQFLEADPIARKLFGIPLEKETDLSKYSIKDIYIFPAERQVRIYKLRDSGGGPISSVLSVRVKGETRLLFDQCWHDGEQDGEPCYAGLVKGIDERVLFPKMFDDFPMGVYELDEENKIVYFNEKAQEIFGFTSPAGLLGKNIAELYAKPEDLEQFSEKVRDDGRAQGVMKFKDAKEKIIELECFTALVDELKNACWGMIHDVTKRERYFRALDKMPTAYYYLEYNKNEEHKHKGKIIHCNEQFAHLLGIGHKEALIGQDVSQYFAYPEKGEAYFRALVEADKKGEPVLDYPFEFRRADNGKIVHVSVDAHLVKDKGKVIGREGTLRDITEKVELERKVKESKEQLDRIAADINNLIHTFLHPVLKFSGHAELFYQSGHLLYQSIRHKTASKTNLIDLARELEDKLTVIAKKLEVISYPTESAAFLRRSFEKIRNVFDYNRMRATKSNRLLAYAIRDAALQTLGELDRADFFKKNPKRGGIGDIITDEFIQDLQDILFGYLLETAQVLKSETQVMKREVESLRRYIGVGQKKEFMLKKCNLSKILEENIATFEPVMAQRDIKIKHEFSDSLMVIASENDIDRVICNLLHNAQKYSYPGSGRFVKIEARELDRENLVEIRISSYGIPIKQHEIDSGKIFDFGYRGEMAYQTDRDGTGVGLADARDVIEFHGGKITIYSEPKGDDGSPLTYKVPYRTIVTIRLPKSQAKKESRK